MALSTLDPLTDIRWSDFLALHPEASVFHTPGWLEALRRTYGYEPVVYTTAHSAQPLENGIAVCRVESWLTGRRWVSVPFADHCQPLAAGPIDLERILEAIREEASWARAKYLELRPLHLEVGRQGLFGASSEYYFQRLDLTPSVDDLYQRLHKTSIRQPIKRAERDGLELREGTSNDLLHSFYELLLLTRRKHGLPPQPRRWFRSVLDHLPGQSLLRVAMLREKPVAAIMTLSFNETHYYKYGCSHPDFVKHGATPWLLWRAITEAKEQGARWFDMGRSDIENEGLWRFKEHFGPERLMLRYLRSPPPRRAPSDRKPQGDESKMTLARAVFSRLPDRVLVATGEILYKHMG
ncbi:MAG: GNAT family N-acetyltransferase [Planctomycetota bacterium]